MERQLRLLEIPASLDDILPPPMQEVVEEKKTERNQDDDEDEEEEAAYNLMVAERDARFERARNERYPRLAVN